MLSSSSLLLLLLLFAHVNSVKLSLFQVVIPLGDIDEVCSFLLFYFWRLIRFPDIVCSWFRTLLLLQIRRTQHAFINPSVTIILRMGAGGHGVPPLGSPDGK